MTIGSVLIIGGILLLNAAVRDQSIATIISDILGGKKLDPVGMPETATVNGLLGGGGDFG